jgi:hypothetical protein
MVASPVERRNYSGRAVSKVKQLDVLMSKDFDGECGPWVPLPEIIALGIGPYSRRFQDLRKVYEPLGFDVENRIERGNDGVTRSWYRKVRKSYPRAERETPHQSPQIKKARRSPGAWRAQSITTSRTWADVVRERNEKLAAEQEDFVLTP